MPLADVIAAWQKKQYIRGYQGCLAFACVCIDAQMSATDATRALHRMIEAADSVGAMLLDMSGTSFFDAFGRQIPAEEVSAGDVVQVDRIFAGDHHLTGKRRVFFGVIDASGRKLQVFGPNGFDITLFEIWLSPPQNVKVWRINHGPIAEV